MNNIIELIANNLVGKISNEMIVFLISLVPILELRGSMIAASILGVPYLRALIISIIGNAIPVPFIILFIEKILVWLESTKHFGGFAKYLRKKVDKNREQIDKYGFWGLTIFVGIPLPGTGAWTGSLIAALLHMDFKKSAPAVILGIIIAAAIMSIISYGVIYNLIH